MLIKKIKKLNDKLNNKIQYFYFIYALPYICGVINKCNKLFFDTI